MKYTFLKFRLIYSIIFVTFISCLHAQDILITKGGDLHVIYDTEIGESAIFYKKGNTIDSPILKMTKDSVLIIKKKDGTKIDFSTNAQSNTATNADFKDSTKEDSLNIIELNNKIRGKYNIDIKPEGKEEKPKKARIGACLLWATDDSKFADNNVEISFETQYIDYNYSNGDKFLTTTKSKNFDIVANANCCFPQLSITIKNKSNKVIYIDLGNTFFMRGGTATVFYQPSVTTTSAGRSNGASVNLGSIANGLGIGGAIGTIAGGINVGGGKNKSTSKTVFSQRFIAIPPKSTKQLENQLFFPDGYIMGSFYGENSRSWTYACLKVNGKLSEDDVIELSPNNENKFGVYLTYDVIENFSNAKNLHANFYIKRIIGSRLGTLVIPQGQNPLIFGAKIVK